MKIFIMIVIISMEIMDLQLLRSIKDGQPSCKNSKMLGREINLLVFQTVQLTQQLELL